MNKPNGYDEAKASGEFTPVELGGHYCVIKQVSEKVSATGKDMIVVLFDFCRPDRQEGYFMKSFKEDVREEKKWPYAGTAYIMVNDYNDPSKTSKNFKTFCNCAEKSNNFTIQWGNDWGKQFVGKKIGAVYGNVENEYNGKTSMRPTMRWFCSVDAVPNAKIPDDKLLKKDGAKKDDTSFMAIPENASEEIPF